MGATRVLVGVLSVNLKLDYGVKMVNWPSVD